MLRKIIIAFFLLLSLLTLPIHAYAAKDYVAERFDVLISVQSDGTLIVTETIVFRFEGGPFTFVFRSLNYTNLDSIDQLQASMDGKVFSVGAAAGQAEMIAGNPLKVTWHFSPTSDAVHEFVLTYRVLGAIQYFDSSNTLNWRAIPEVHDYPIEQSQITLAYPPSTTLLQPPQLTGTESQSETGEQTVIFTASPIEPNRPVDIWVDFQTDSLVQNPPNWQALKLDLERQTKLSRLLGFTASGGVFLWAVLFLIHIYRRNQYEGFSFPNVAQPVTTLPVPIGPALPTRLIGGKSTGLATLFDLARRGYIQFEEMPDSSKPKQYVLSSRTKPETLEIHEEKVLKALFDDNLERRLPLEDVSRRLAEINTWLNNDLDDRLISIRWVDPERKHERKSLLHQTTLAFWAGLLVLVGGVFFAEFLFAISMVWTGVTLILMSILARLAVNRFSILSREGERQKTTWKTFANFLEGITKGDKPVTQPDLFSLYLPFAIGFGHGGAWVKFFEKQENVPIPSWFYALNPQETIFSDISDVIWVSSDFQSRSSPDNFDHSSAWSSDGGSFDSGGFDGGGDVSGGGDSGAG